MIFGFKARQFLGQVTLNCSEHQFDHQQNGSDDNHVVGNININIFIMYLIENVCSVLFPWQLTLGFAHFLNVSKILLNKL